MNRRCAQRRESALGRQEDLLPVASTKGDEANRELAEIELRRDSTGTGRARRTSSEKPRLRISSPPDRHSAGPQRPFLPLNLSAIFWIVTTRASFAFPFAITLSCFLAVENMARLAHLLNRSFEVSRFACRVI